MNLPPRRTRLDRLPYPLEGRLVRSSPPTVAAPLTGRIADVDGYAVTVRLDGGLMVAVDIEDCVLLD